MVEPFIDDTATVFVFTVLPIMVENPTCPAMILETRAVDVASVLPAIVEVVNAVADKVEPVTDDRRTMLPVIVENVKEPPYIVETDRVDVTTLLPCAVEKRSTDVIVLDRAIRFTIRVLPVKLDAVTFTPLSVGPVSVETTDSAFVVTVRPPRVDTYAFLAPIVELVILDITIVLPPSVE
jgi:hypothetical protein